MYLSNINSTSITVKGVSKKEIAKDETITIHSPDDLTLIYLNQGAMHCTFEDETFQIKKWDLILLNKDQSIEVSAVRKVHRVEIALSGVLFSSSQTNASFNKGVYVVSDKSQVFKKYIDMIIFEEENRFRATDSLQQKLFENLMIHVLRHNELEIKDSRVQVKHEEIQIIQDYIRDNYAERITLDQLADMVDINKYYLIRLFKLQTGLSPIDYLIHVRLREAEKMLTQTNITISSISEQVGFHSPSHFSMTFKENNHCTPTEYRRQYSNF